MTNIKCGSCGSVMHRLEIGRKKYFLCTADTQANPINIDIGTGIAVDAYVCVSCGSISLQADEYIGRTPNR